MKFSISVLYIFALVFFNLFVHGEKLQCTVAKYGDGVAHIFDQSITCFRFSAAVARDILLTNYCDEKCRNQGSVNAYYTEFQHREKLNKNVIEAINLQQNGKTKPQLSLVKFNDNFAFKKGMTIFMLPQQPYREGDRCILLTKALGDNPYGLQGIEVKITGTCPRGSICVEPYNVNDNVDLCEEFVGGEPIICNGILTGIGIDNECQKGQLKATHIFDFIEWVKTGIEKLSPKPTDDEETED